MAAALFDMSLRAMRRDRAFRAGPELFLHERAIDDCLYRIGLVQRRFESALLLGCPDPNWRARVEAIADTVMVAEPGPLFARAAEAELVNEDAWHPSPEAFNLCIAPGTLDTVNHLPAVLGALRQSLRGDSLLIGAVAGGDSLPRLRGAMRAADAVCGAASAHVHPRIEAAALGPLLTAAGFIMPVIDVDRVDVAYPSLGALIRDLRAMAATNILAARDRRPLSREAWREAQAAFGQNGQTLERFEILHFAAWTPPK